MDYSKEFKNYAIKHHGINSLYYEKIVSSMTPYIIEERQLNVAQMDVFSGKVQKIDAKMVSASRLFGTIFYQKSVKNLC